MSRRNFVSLFLLMLFVTAGTAASGPFLPIYWSSSVSGVATLGWVMSGYAIAKIFSGWAGGYLSSGLGCMTMIRLGAGMCLAASCGYLIFPPQAGWLFILQVMYGAGVGLVRPMASAYIGVYAVRDSIGRLFGRFETAFYAALAAGPLVGGYVTEHYGIMTLMSVVVACNLAAFVCSFFAGCEKCVQRRPVSGETGVCQKLLMVYIFGRTFGITAVSMFLPIYLSQNFKMGGFKVGLAAVAICGVSAVCMPVCGYITDKTNKSVSLGVSTFFVSVLIFCLPVIGSEPLFWVAALVIGFLSAQTKTSSVAMLLSTAVQGGQAYLMGMFNTVMNIGFCFAAFICGVLAKTPHYGISYVFYLSGLIGIVSCLTFHVPVCSARTELISQADR